MFSPSSRKRKARVVAPTVLTSEMGPVLSLPSGVKRKFRDYVHNEESGKIIGLFGQLRDENSGSSVPGSCFRRVVANKRLSFGDGLIIHERN
jgi:hypothetical protein